MVGILDKYLEAHGLTRYRLAKESGISQTTWFKRNSTAARSLDGQASTGTRGMQWQSELKVQYPGLHVESCPIGPYVGTYTGSKAIGLIWSPKL
mgnify:CR=1 FL=1